ncbi:hypothetical protein FQN55_001336 [Onygenales sp. PD_40]|nr:hypothetical protein FQN55_001336 [Onygenales sp. PD_40]
MPEAPRIVTMKYALVSGLLAAISAGGVDASPHKHRHLDVYSHRGGMGLRTESSLWSFAYGLETGADYLEMDIVFTKDGIPVVWHDHSIDGDKCTGEFVGQFVVDLSLAEIKTLNCNKQLTKIHPQQEVHADTKIQTLEEVLDLIDCYGDKKVRLNIETKLRPTTPNETWPPEKYIDDIIPILERRGYASRSIIQSFDWRTLIGIHKRWPKIPISALLDQGNSKPADDGTYPWLGGVNLDDFDGDWVAAAKSIGNSVLSASHGGPKGCTVNTPGYEPWTTKEVVDRAHKLGMTFVSGTLDDEVTMEKLINDGVDGIITNYPQRLMWVAGDMGVSTGHRRNRHRPECLPKEE